MLRIKPLSIYRVRWEIDLEATSAKEAAQMALSIHRDPKSIATIFDVAKRKNMKADVKGLEYRHIDLME